MEDVEDITPEADPSYDLGELADVTDDQAYRRWMVDSQRKNNSLMRRILHLVTGGCIGGSNQRQSPAAQTPRPHCPGKEPMGTCPSTEESKEESSMKKDVILEYPTQNSQSDQSEGCSRGEQASGCSRSLRKLPRFRKFALESISSLFTTGASI
ncbi:hypothetical protein F2Q69_00042653 [Brassica cretica]|uniref:Uncharacterized protein n=1 Tax=Brassica cretica TaxID=69181 RepID=A0A8S9NDS5_BRACR|nr:hypothetical protein F2Q69_00042653 [Brassica cretica]